MATKQTAVEWIFQRMNEIRVDDECERLSVIDFFNLQFEAKEQAKQMEKEQLKAAHYDGQRTTSDCGADKEFSEEYYNETYNATQLPS
jgi:hypothetical protein